MQIVSNTTLISELYKIGQLELLQRVYNRILIPEAVLQELQRARTLPRLGRAVEQTGWIEIHALRHPDKIQEMLSHYSSIDAGEAAAIILAQELDANRIIMDDKRARQVAQAEGLAVIGTVGVVLLAHRLRRVSTPQAQLILDQLYAGTAYISTGTAYSRPIICRYCLYQCELIPRRLSTTPRLKDPLPLNQKACHSNAREHYHGSCQPINLPNFSAPCKSESG